MNQDAQGIDQVVRKIFENWSAMQPDANDSLFFADDQTVLFDVESMMDVGWNSQKARLKRDFGGLKEFAISPEGSLLIHQQGTFAWVTCIWNARGIPHDGTEFVLRGRGTFVLCNRNGEWRAVHDHISMPKN